MWKSEAEVILLQVCAYGPVEVLFINSLGPDMPVMICTQTQTYSASYAPKKLPY